MKPELVIRQKGLEEYLPIWQAMQNFTDSRTPETQDEIWLLQHPPVFTQGLAGKPEHLLNPGNIPLVLTDRGGQVTYHGPGQLVVYTLLDIQRLGIGTRQLVKSLEDIIIRLLGDYGIEATANCDARGVYITDAKICSIGLRIRKGYCYHGLALNVDMNLEPFSRINPCGYRGLPITQLSDFVSPVDWVAIETKIIQYFIEAFGYGSFQNKDELVPKSFAGLSFADCRFQG